MSADTYLLFFAASVALGLAPGPDNLFVLAQSSQHGTRAGLLVTLGLCTGLIFHTLLVAFGVAVIFQTSELAFTALKLMGAGYLTYLALQSFRAGQVADTKDALDIGRLYRRGIIMNITNPKVAIFFLAFLPQFIQPELGNVTVQTLILGALFIIATMVVFGGVAAFAGLIGGWIRQSPWASRFLNYLVGVVFLGLAVRLVMTER